MLWVLGVLVGACAANEVVYAALCNRTLTLDNGEWWLYALSYDAGLVQYHEDRKGLKQSKKNPTPTSFALGTWNLTHCEDTAFFVLPSQEFYAVGRAVKTLRPVLGVGNGWIQKVQFVHEAFRATAVFKVSNHLFLLDKAPPVKGVFHAQITEPSGGNLREHPAYLAFDEYFTCRSCNFYDSVQTGDTLLFDPGEVTRVVRLVMDAKLLVLDKPLEGSVTQWRVVQHRATCELSSDPEYSSSWNPFVPMSYSVPEYPVRQPFFVLPEAGRGLITFEVRSSGTLLNLTLAFYQEETEVAVLFLDSSTHSFLSLKRESYFKNQIQFKNKLWFVIHEGTLLVGTGPYFLTNTVIVHYSPEFVHIDSLGIAAPGAVSLKDIGTYALPTDFLAKSLRLSEDRPSFEPFSVTLSPGTSCGDGYVRTSRVDFVCGSAIRLIEVDEYALCRYRVVVSNPLLCPRNLTVLSSPSPTVLLTKSTFIL